MRRFKWESYAAISALLLSKFGAIPDIWRPYFFRYLRLPTLTNGKKGTPLGNYNTDPRRAVFLYRFHFAGTGYMHRNNTTLKLRPAKNCKPGPRSQRFYFLGIFPFQWGSTPLPFSNNPFGADHSPIPNPLGVGVPTTPGTFVL